MFKLLFILLFLALPAYAQQALTPEQEASVLLGRQIGLLTIENTQLFRQLQDAQKQIDELKKKLEEKK